MMHERSGASATGLSHRRRVGILNLHALGRENRDDADDDCGDDVAHDTD